MGIKKLNKFIGDKNLIKTYNNIGEYIKAKKRLCNTNNNIVTTVNNIVIAVDFMLYFYKFSYAYDSFIIGFWNQISFLLTHRITPIYIFDNKYPPEKSDVIMSRNRKKDTLKKRLETIKMELENVNKELHIDTHIIDFLEKEKIKLEKRIITVNQNAIDMAKDFFTQINIPFIQAKSEADIVCASLYKTGLITSCLSDDMDMLCYGCESVIKFQQSKVIEYDLNFILSSLELTYDQFVDMCILFGCDYLKPNFKMDINIIYKNIKTHKSISAILKKDIYPEFNTDKSSYFKEQYNDIEKLFRQKEVIDIPIPSITVPLVIDKILRLLDDHKENNMSKEERANIIKCISYINNHITNKDKDKDKSIN